MSEEMMASDGIRAWLADAPTPVRDTTTQLLHKVADLRHDQVIYPPQDSILAALSLTPPESVRAVILGQDPYHEPGQAMGLSFSVPEGQRIPPSLRNIYKEMATDLGCEVPTSGDLTSWARQGVLLLNTTLTVQAHKANSHVKMGWQTLTGYVIHHAMELPQPIVFLAWGRHAVNLIRDAEQEASGRGTFAGEKFMLASTHPSPLSANRAAGDLAPFMGSRPFSRANAILTEHGAAPIDWTSVLD